VSAQRHRGVTEQAADAAVDRLTLGGNIIETSTDSYRLAHSRAR
jgi:hypothetical protein